MQKSHCLSYGLCLVYCTSRKVNLKMSNSINDLQTVKIATLKEQITEGMSLSLFLVGDVKIGTLNHLTSMTGLLKSN